MVILDFETRSRCNLITRGAYNYALDASTDIICMAAYCLNTESRWLWFPDKPIPEPLQYALKHTDFVAAHNAEFDMNIYDYVATEYGFPEIDFDKWYCTSAQARVNGLPAGLDDAAWAVGLKTRKMNTGAGLIRKLSIPQKDGSFNKDPALIEQMGDYCMQDVIVTANLYRSTRPMMAEEHRDWLNTVKVNRRGVKVDVELAKLATNYAEAEKNAIGQRLSALTDGCITSHSQSAKLRTYLHNRSDDNLKDLMKVVKDGETKLSMDKTVRRNILAAAEENPTAFDPVLIEVVALTDEGNKSSVAKFEKMLTLADDEDDRVRGAFMYAGAAQTLRYTSRGLQLHNIRRDCFSPSDTETFKQLMRQGKPLDNVMDTLSKLLRPAIIPEKDNVLVVGDWSSIEARVLPWLSDTDTGDEKLDWFESGADVYVETALRMGLKKEDRQTGKIAELACGYQGGVNAFKLMASLYGFNISDTKAQLYVNSWRAANPWAVKFWSDLENAAMRAISNAGTRFSAGMVDYEFYPNLMGGTLLCIMPNDTVIQYPKVRIVEDRYGHKITSLKASVRPKADDKDWPRTNLYGGLLAENCTQAFAAAILRNALAQLDNVIASIHDEIILEVPKQDAEQAVKTLKEVMTAVPDWAAGLPLAAEPAIFNRYGK